MKTNTHSSLAHTPTHTHTNKDEHRCKLIINHKFLNFCVPINDKRVRMEERERNGGKKMRLQTLYI